MLAEENLCLSFGIVTFDYFFYCTFLFLVFAWPLAFVSISSLGEGDLFVHGLLWFPVPSIVFSRDFSASPSLGIHKDHRSDRYTYIMSIFYEATRVVYIIMFSKQ